jgi:hypothetical protein
MGSRRSPSSANKPLTDSALACAASRSSEFDGASPSANGSATDNAGRTRRSLALTRRRETVSPAIARRASSASARLLGLTREPGKQGRRQTPMAVDLADLDRELSVKRVGPAARRVSDELCGLIQRQVLLCVR